ncbi:ParB/RepB/Spo0J family partition protein [Candidatus Peregrinibacteria bacterium]|nr:ParB/RepB/Spo0J family partition protein [Candidatus Peregrinibacteria bacterium]
MSEVTGKLEKPLPYEELTHGIIGQAIRDKAMIGNDLHCQDGSLIRLPTLEDKRYCIPLDLISPNPTQPRRYFDPEALNELAGSIESIGQLTPILVVPFIIQIDGHKTIRFFIVGGERRFRALNKLKETHALAVISWNNDEDDLFSKAYIDNYHEKLNVLDEARSIRRMSREK